MCHYFKKASFSYFAVSMHLNPQIICKKPFCKLRHHLQTRESNKRGAVFPTALSSACPALHHYASAPFVLSQGVLVPHFPVSCPSSPCSLRCSVSASSIYLAVHVRTQGPRMEGRHPYLHFPGECCGHSLCVSKILFMSKLPKQLKPGAGCRCYPRTVFGLG